MVKNFFLLPVGLFILAVGLPPGTVLATTTSAYFQLSPAKNELRLDPGARLIRNLYLTNHLGYDAVFRLEVEDVAGTQDAKVALAYYGSGLGPYSIKNYLITSSDTVAVKNGATIPVPILITLPSKVTAGGFYGGVFISPLATSSPTGSGPQVTTRLGSLFFLRVNGRTTEEGKVTRFSLAGEAGIIWNANPAELEVVFANTGNIYLSPYGYIDLSNAGGNLLKHLPIEPWYVFPDSVRSRLVSWTDHPLFGKFTATLVLNSGETKPTVTTKVISFWIIPLKLILEIIAALVVLLFGYRLVVKLKT